MHKHIRRLLAAIVLSSAAACSPPVPSQWRDIPLVKDNLVRVEDTTDSHGLYVEYKGVSREALLQRVTASLLGAGYARAGAAFEGSVLGFSKGPVQLAVKVDQFGETLYLAIFDEAGKEPLLHGVAFGKYQLGEAKSGTEAAEALRKELEK